MRSLRYIDVVRVFLFAFAVLACAAPPAPASADEFYAPPPDITKFAPGEIIRSESISPAPEGARAWKLLYASTGISGERIAVSGVVIVPVGAPPKGGRPIVAWAHPTTGIEQGCAPSIRGQKFYSTIPDLASLISHGYIVAATDYPGLGTPGPHPYLVGRSEGQAVLDSVRAARKWTSEAGSQFAAWGHSQGGQAALFAGQLAASYAPELTLAGIAAISPPTDLSDMLHHFIRQGNGRVVSAYALVSWSQVYQLSLDGVVRSAAIPAVKRVARECAFTTIDSYKVTVDSLPLRSPFLEPSLYTTSPWDGLLAANRPTIAPGGAPIFIAQGKLDELVPADITVAFARAECKLGATVLYDPLAEVGHDNAGVVSAHDAVAWMAQRFAGKASEDSCPLDAP
jgi:acetyl esterase/lipase